MTSRRRSPQPSNGNQPSSNSFIAIVVTAMTVLGGIGGSFITSYMNSNMGEMIGRQTALAELAPTINTLQTSVTSASSSNPIIPSQIVTITEIIEVTPTPNQNEVTLEALQGEVNPFFGTQDPEVLQGFGTLFVGFNNNLTPFYRYNYIIPDEGKGYAGFVYRFSAPQDLTRFQSIQLTITYEDPTAKAQISLGDVESKFSYIRLADGFVNGKNIETSGNERTQVVTIPIGDNFTDVNKQAVRSIGFGADASFTRGSHTFIIQDVKLIR